jgi:hypothetical protein
MARSPVTSAVRTGDFALLRRACSMQPLEHSLHPVPRYKVKGHSYVWHDQCVDVKNRPPGGSPVFESDCFRYRISCS